MYANLSVHIDHAVRNTKIALTDKKGGKIGCMDFNEQLVMISVNSYPNSNPMGHSWYTHVMTLVG